MVERNLFRPVMYVLLLTIASCSFDLGECEDKDDYPSVIENEIEYFVEVQNSKLEPLQGVSVEVNIYKNWCSIGAELVSTKTFVTDADGLATDGTVMRYINSDEEGKWYVTLVHKNLRYGKFERSFYQSEHTLTKTFVIHDLDD